SARRTRSAGAAATLALIAAVVAVGTGPGEAQRAEAAVLGSTLRAPFRVVNDRGKTLLRVADSRGGALVDVFDRDGQRIARIRNLPGRRGLEVADEREFPAAFMGTDTEQVAGLTAQSRGFQVLDEQGRQTARLAHLNLPEVGSDITGLEVLDANGVARLRATRNL